MGRTFEAVNERGKVQITDANRFAPPVLKLSELLSSPEFLELLSYVMDIPHLLADPELIGGGMHQTGPRGHLDVHVDFNFIAERNLHRRLNILIYLNEDWRPEWGGAVELWDQDVRECHHSLLPIFNRCVVFETSDISFHGVTAVNCPPDRRGAVRSLLLHGPSAGALGRQVAQHDLSCPSERAAQGNGADAHGAGPALDQGHAAQGRFASQGAMTGAGRVSRAARRADIRRMTCGP